MAIINSKHSVTVNFQPKYNSESVVKYLSRGVKTGRCKDSVLVMDVKKHLSAIGWSFNVVLKASGKKELRYRSPAGKDFVTLIKACESLVDCNGCYVHNLELGGFNKPAKKYDRLCNDDDLNGSKIEEFSKELEQQLVNCDSDVDLGGSVIDEVKENKAKYGILDSDDSSDSFKIDEFSRELEMQLVSDEENRPNKKIRVEDVESSYFPVIVENKRSEGKKIQDMKRIMECGNKLKPQKVIRKTKGVSRPRCVLSLLIEKGVVLRGSNVSYKKKDGTAIAKGRIYDEGILCNCCGLLFLLSKFEAHAGSTNHRPAAFLFLDDNRSLFDCQAELNLNRENKPSKVTKSIKSADDNDEFCSFCKDGGELLLCDSCTSSFHSACVGLNGVPDSDFWHCPSCSCRICHQGGQISKLTAKEQIKCVQCEHYFHIDCLKKLGFLVYSDSAEWLCSEKCERINFGLMGILGKPISLPVDNLSWNLLKLEDDENDRCRYTESYSKLLGALDVMHECFQPVKHPWSDNDLVEDVIFSRSSKRSSFKGFFTAVLEKDDEMITVISVRIHGSKVAEIPLVATRFKYRKLGMCRILMNELEMKLGDLGVERLVLPAVPEMISTWIESFGFSVMTDPERLDVVECKFLEFPGTIKCQKMLKKK